tara:strand:+ start:415658 stop:417337 length:1680 start_codon:yes stop_codon:yes gene_type:complete
MSKKIQDNKAYIETIKNLLDNYEEGWDIFINAKKAGTWDYAVNLKEGVAPSPDLPKTWIDLVEKVVGIIAKEKYDLETYDNTIELITADQMLDQYTSVGLPVNYQHWSYAKSRAQHEAEYKRTGGMAFEIVINSDPAIAYCMEGNSPMMQILVIAHASFGHNNFFKQNYMFKEYTKASDIVPLSRDLRDFIYECEARFGEDEVEKLLDSCHALMNNAVSAEHFFKSNETRLDNDERTDIFSGVNLKDQFARVAGNPEAPLDCGMEQNILCYLADQAPHLPEWKRKIMRLVSEVATYFHPQRQTQVMNEGWASFWHYTLVHDLSELGLIDHGMMMEFYDSHGGVVRQTGITDTVTVRGADGQPEERNIYSGINPYALGISMFQDIKRICLEPTEEDKKWFPYIAGNEDWLSVMKDARNNFKDESFIQQFMSPKLMRDFKFFAMENDSDKDYVEILAIHDTDGYSAVRENLSAQYRYDENMPVIGVAEYYDKTDRRLVLNHKMHNGKPLDKKNMTEITKHMYRLWEHPIVVQSIDKDGDVVDETCCPAKPDVRRQRKLRLN